MLGSHVAVPITILVMVLGNFILTQAITMHKAVAISHLEHENGAISQ